MSDHPVGTVTFLFTDIEGSTQLWERHPEAMRDALARHDALLRAAIVDQGGRVFKTVGDAFCAAFATAPAGVEAAIAIQRALAAEPWPAPLVLRVRMALHTGAAQSRDDDYFGPPLNRVARLLPAGHGGHVLLTEATGALVRDSLPEGASLLAAGAHRLKDLSRSESVFLLRHPALVPPESLPPLRTLDALPNNLPPQLTSFVGREKELEEVRARLERTRLLTLTGSGGTGKTRLALQLAADRLDPERFPDGAWIAELAAVADPALVPQTVAATLGVREAKGEPIIRTLTTWLRDKRLLLTLDNCEHVLDACARLADEILRFCPTVTLLASSREGLGITGETLYRVPSLSPPEAEQLFVERAEAARTDFAVRDTPALASLCRRLDGIPLAIELAAARARALSLEELDRRLDDRFRLLTGGSRTALPRQQTLRALIDWSYELLSDQQKALLARLSVFRGGWTLAAAEAVCAGDAVEEWEVLDLLVALVDKSLVLTDEPAARYRLLETVRQYARERLSAADAELYQARHRAHFLALVEEAETELTGPAQRRWLGTLDAEHDNLRQALDSCGPDRELALRLAGALGAFWNLRGYYAEARERLERALDGASSPSPAFGKALLMAGFLATNQGDFAAGRPLLERSLATARAAGDALGAARALCHLGNAARGQGDFAAAGAFLDESLATARAQESAHDAARALYGLGQLAFVRADYAGAQVFLEEALAGYRALRDTQRTADALYSLAPVAAVQGDYATARTRFEESLAAYRELGNRHAIANALHGLGNIALMQAEYATAQPLYEECLDLFEAVGHQPNAAATRVGLGLLAHYQGDHDTAWTLLDAALSGYQEYGSRLDVAEVQGYQGRVALARGEREAARSRFVGSLADCQELGHPDGVLMQLEGLAAVYLSSNPRRATVLFGATAALRERLATPAPPVEEKEREQRRAQARAALGETEFEAAWAEGRDLSMDQASAYAQQAG